VADLLRSYSGDWSPEGLETCLKGYAESQGTKIGDVAKPCRAALTGSTASPGLFEVIWSIGKDVCVGRLEDAAAGLCTIKEPPAPKTAAADPAPAAAAAATAAAAPPVVLSGDIDAQVKAVGDSIRDLKTKLKADGLSGKKIDVNDDVKALVAQLQQLKVAQAAGPLASALAASPLAVSGDVDAQVKDVGDEIRALKAKLKADGLSGKKIDASDEVKALVAKLTALKAAQAAAPSPAAAPAVAPAAVRDVEAQVKAVGDEIRSLKAKLKADGMSGKKIDATPEVKELVAKLTELKSVK